MDKLDEIFAKQKELDEYIKKARGLEFKKEEWMQKKCLALIAEIAEFLDEVNYKWWKNEKEINETAVKAELSDIFHFFVSLCIDAGMTGEELHKYYIEKNEENRNRQKEKKDYIAAYNNA